MTIEDQPLSYSGANDLLLWTVYDSNAIDPAKENYQYVAQLFIDSVNVFTAREYPNPTNNRGEFNLGTVIRQYLNAAFKAEQGQGEFALDIEVKFGEQYTGTSNLNITSSTHTVFNCYKGRYYDFTFINGYTNYIATDRPRTVKIVKGSTAYYVPYFSTGTTGITVTVNGVTTTVTPTVANTMQRINIAAPSATSDYTATVGGYTFNVKLVCPGHYTNYTLHFLNRFGGWESMLFNMVCKLQYSSEKRYYNQLPYRVSSSGIISLYSSGVMHQQRTVIGTEFDEKVRIQTDFLTDAEYLWLKELAFSPLVFMQDDPTQDLFWPIHIENTSYEPKQHIVEGLTTLSMDVAFGVKYNTQFQ